ncbi:unnamed protein product [Clonostachys rosea f. rosea IK726]|jgi:hypothetical protein|uniref:Phosphatidylinositol-specific phospholipase C X domain-containing protein n=2 Tax=Bionectria ochroleuca TaxID=29856 RepID=A0A0B7JPN8_BIOOC|nr:unnamed protein product [Clonostachys rosea f. rosea IK726]
MKFFSFASLALVGAFSSVASAATACNNSPTLCNRNYNNITYLGGHNSAFLRDASTDNSISGNQYFNASVALSAGLRLLQAQVHKENNTLRLCHTSCSLLDAGPLQNWLGDVKSWMDKNPNDVVTILLVDSDSATTDEYASAFTGSGISEYGFTPSGSWPTLQSMINNGTRLVSYVTGITASSSAPYLLNEWSYVFETAYNVISLTGFNCTLDRPTKAGTASSALSSGLLGLANHFKYATGGTLQIPDVDNINIVNNAGTSTDGNIGKHLNTCNSEWSTKPTYVLVDFFSEGNPLDAVDSLNGISDVTGRTAAPARSTTSGVARPSKPFEFVAILTFLSAVLILC